MHCATYCGVALSILSVSSERMHQAAVSIERRPTVLDRLTQTNMAGIGKLGSSCLISK